MGVAIFRITAVLSVFWLVTACSDDKESGGTSTDVGGGGSGIEAIWHETVDELEQDLRLIVATPLEVPPEDFARIKEEFPKIIRSVKLRFVNHPLLLGIETPERDNPLGISFVRPQECSTINDSWSVVHLRDAINFPSIGLIKVSLPRLLCYIAKTDQLRRLVLHEYLGLLGYPEIEDDKTTYRYTNAILDAIREIHRFEEGLDVRWVRTCKEFERIGEDGDFSGDDLGISVPVLLYKLANDIDCQGVDFRRRGGFFRPKSLQVNIDGNGYSLRNIKIEPLENSDRRESLSIFTVNCSHCTIANLRIVDAYVDGEAILLLRNLGTISNVSMGGKLKARFSGYTGFRNAREAGGVVRENVGLIANLNANLEIEGNTLPSASPVSEEWIGGIVASNYGNISRSTAKVRIRGSGYLGGFSAWNTGSISSVVAKPLIEGRNVLGVAGFSVYNEGRLEKIYTEGAVRILDGPQVLAPEGLVANATVAGGLIAFARSIGKETLPAGLSAAFPFSVGDTLADVKICGSSRFKNSARDEQDLRSPLIAQFDGKIDARVEVARNRGIIFDSYGIGEITDSCSEESP